MRRYRTPPVRAAGLFLLAAALPALAQGPLWQARGPAPNTRGQVEKLKDGQVTGAVNAVAPHPVNADVLYVGAANGGIWTTANASAADPTWKPLTDGLTSLSIGALEFDPTDANHNTLVAGVGRFSSFMSVGGARSGLLRTTDAGGTWKELDGGGALRGLNVSGVAPRGATIVLSANAADASAKAGVWRSTDTGVTWKQVSGDPASGLPAGRSAHLAGNRKVSARLFAHGGSGGTAGVYRSTDTGATWKRVGTPAMHALVAKAGNVKLAVGGADSVYAAVVVSGELAEVFRSADGGNTWAGMGAPKTADGEGAHPGSQGDIHLSLAADPTSPDVVYVGGDRQNNPFPNAIGAMDYSGRLFRGVAGNGGAKWVPLTHKKTPDGGGTGTGTSPHADSRAMAVSAGGVLFEGDDGGVYRRTSPKSNAGDWSSLNGNLQVTEFHAVAYDAVAKVVIGGAQDTGTPEQRKALDPMWRSVSTADGGVVAVDDLTAAALSVRYSSNQFLGGFRRRSFTPANALVGEVFVSLVPTAGSPGVSPQFYTPIRLHAVTPTRLVIGGGNGVFESFDRGDTVTLLSPAVVANGTGPNPFAYGAKDNPAVLYVGSGNQVFVRKTAAGTLAPTAVGGGLVVGLAGDPAKAARAVAVDPTKVFLTKNHGTAWDDVTGNLQALKPGTLRSVAYSTAAPPGVIAVGADAGVFIARGPAFNVWSKFGAKLPRSPVYSLEYDAKDNLLLAGTLGRGAWTVSMAGLPPAPPGAADPDDVPAGAPAPAPAAQPPDPKEASMPTFSLRPGIVVNRPAGQVYVMTPEGGVAALDAATGKAAWESRDAARPVSVAGNKLIAQVEAEATVVKIATLDLKTGKAVGAGGSVPVPAGVKATVQATPQGDFALAAAGGPAADPILTWQFTPRQKQALPPGTDGVLQPAGPPPLGLAPTRGAFKVSADTGAATPLPAPPPGPVGVSPLVTPPGVPLLPGVPGRHLFSADRQHVLASELADPGVWESNRLTVYDRAGKKVGEFRSHLSGVPFFVAGNVAVFETTPYRRPAREGDPKAADPDGDGLVEEPAKVRGVNLTTGREVWSRAVRETVFRGPQPP